MRVGPSPRTAALDVARALADMRHGGQPGQRNEVRPPAVFYPEQRGPRTVDRALIKENIDEECI